MALWILLALQFAATALGLGYLWRRQQRLSDEVAHLRAALATLQVSRAARVARVAEKGAAVRTEQGVVAISAKARAARTWGATEGGLRPDALMPVDTARGLALGAAAAAPALGLFFGVNAAVLVAAGVAAGALMLLLSLRAEWRAAAWPAAITAAAWGLIGLTLGAAQGAPAPYCAFTALAALT